MPPVQYSSIFLQQYNISWLTVEPCKRHSNGLSIVCLLLLFACLYYPSMSTHAGHWLYWYLSCCVFLLSSYLQEVYGEEPLEDGEIDDKRQKLYNSCLRRETKNAKRVRFTRFGIEEQITRGLVDLEWWFICWLEYWFEIAKNNSQREMVAYQSSFQHLIPPLQHIASFLVSLMKSFWCLCSHSPDIFVVHMIAHAIFSFLVSQWPLDTLIPAVSFFLRVEQASQV